MSQRAVLLFESRPPGSVSVMDKGRGAKGHAKMCCEKVGRKSSALLTEVVVAKNVQS